MSRTRAIVVAAGRGERMSQQKERKQFRLLKGIPVFMWSVKALQSAPSIDEIVVVTAAQDVSRVRWEIMNDPAMSKVIGVVAGGETRQASVAQGLGYDAGGARPDWIVIHDGVRPFVDVQLIEAVVAAAKHHGAAIAALPVKETIKEVAARPNGRIVVGTPSRESLWAAQTPQAFARDVLEAAHQRAGAGNATDDSSLVEAMGVSVAIVSGDERNLKITTELDFSIATLLAEEMGQPAPGAASGGASQTVTGFGFDVHQLVPDRPLILGGVSIPHDRGLLGHSDADVLTHAVMDALLGAVALGDIGLHFPDTDPAYAGARSIELLQHVRRLVHHAGGEIIHVDAFVSAERPKLRPFIDEMRRNLAEALGIGIHWVNVKAGTGERKGTVGREEVIEARAVATVRRTARPPDRLG